MSHAVKKCPAVSVNQNPSSGQNRIIPTFVVDVGTFQREAVLTGLCLSADMSQRIRLDVKCVIIATLICPQGGVNPGRGLSLDMIHSLTHSVKRYPGGVLVPTGSSGGGDVKPFPNLQGNRIEHPPGEQKASSCVRKLVGFLSF